MSHRSSHHCLLGVLETAQIGLAERGMQFFAISVYTSPTLDTGSFLLLRLLEGALSWQWISLGLLFATVFLSLSCPWHLMSLIAQFATKTRAHLHHQRPTTGSCVFCASPRTFIYHLQLQTAWQEAVEVARESLVLINGYIYTNDPG